ncbi:serine/threonine-protein kinase [Herpetosiphon giganteus]|uniref:serine/threonine-protein kinase n=1 Tax=Herpetosiphon giganteus TaxID=2029754 RepID=UPI001956F10D|nr:serine/threonine-protein kinase [Herpetosiphon giganteus]MBM7843162.1 serine/threonine-protein kinase [Herpetosiphon giganteus]
MQDPQLIGRMLNHFKIVDKLGQGGMAMVYRAYQENLNRTVALKLLPPEMTFDQSYIARFQQEARAAAGLEHTHIVPIYETGQAEGFYYIVMKYIEGNTLKENIEQEAPMSVNRVLELLEPIGKALDYAHRKGVIHRDIKPSNVMLTPEGWVYLTDFGLARGGSSDSGLTQIGTVMGTPEYMSPEQAQGLAVGAASDLYSLAIMAYEMLTKQMPFVANNPQAVLLARVIRAPRAPSDLVPTMRSAVEDVLMKALARTPEARYATAADFFEALRQANNGAQPNIPATPAFVPNQQPQYAPTPSYPATPMSNQQAAVPPYQPTPLSNQQIRPSYPSNPSNQQVPMYNQSPYDGYVAANTQATKPAIMPVTGQTVQYHQQPISQPSLAAYAPPASAQPNKQKMTIWIGVGVLLLIAAVVGIILANSSDAEDIIAQGDAAFERRGGLIEAINLYKEATAADDESFEAHEKLAIAYLMRGQTPDANEAIRKAIALDANQASGHAWLSQVHSDNRQHNDALAEAEESVRLDGNNPLAYVARATARSDVGNELGDSDLLKQALADADKSIELAANRSRFEQAMAYSAKGYVQWVVYQDETSRDAGAGKEYVVDGIDNFNRAIGLQEQLPLLRNNIGYFYAEQGRVALYLGESDTAEQRFAKAYQSFDDALALDPNYGLAFAGKGWTQIYERKYEEAQQFFDQALERNPKDANALNGRALTNWWLGRNNSSDPQSDYEAAIRDYEAALAGAPSWLSVYVDLGYVYLYDTKDTDKALATFKKALERDPDYPNAIAGLADTYYETRYYDEALKLYEQTIDLKPDFATAYLGKANVLYNRKDYDAAIDQYSTALEYDSSLKNAYIGKAYCYQGKGNIEEARKVLEDGIDSVSYNDQSELKAILDKLK